MKHYDDLIQRLRTATKLPLLQALMNEAADAIEELTAADVRPVVLCRDCKHRDPEDHKCDSGEVERQGCPFEVADDYFCAYGEKREES